MAATHLPERRYTRVAIALHWAMAAMILFNLGLGFFMEGLPMPYRFVVIFLHISAGMTLLVLTVVRVAWRLTHRPPPFPAGLAPWERISAHVVHFGLYGAMVAMPLIGWSIISANPPADAAWLKAPARPAMKLWGVIPTPRITPLVELGRTEEGGVRQKILHDRFVGWHAVGGYLMIGLLLLHVGGALKHEFIDRHAELARMGLPRRRRAPRT